MYERVQNIEFHLNRCVQSRFVAVVPFHGRQICFPRRTLGGLQEICLSRYFNIVRFLNKDNLDSRNILSKSANKKIVTVHPGPVIGSNIL